MKYPVADLPEVRTDILNAVSFYNEISVELAEQFLSRLEEANSEISDQPLSFQIKYGEVRTYNLKQFPYLIHFVFRKSESLILVLAVIHSNRNPIDYSSRINP